MTGRAKAGLESAQKELGKDLIVVSSDARSLTEIDALASRVKAEFDTFDLLFVNAGFSCRASLENTTEAIYDEMFNLIQLWRMTSVGPVIFLEASIFGLASQGKRTVISISTFISGI